MLKVENIFINQKIKSKQKCIEKIIKILMNNDVSPTYCESIYDRQKLASFSIGNSIAVPHGTYEEMNKLKESILVILHLEKPISWDKDKVQLVIGLAIKIDDQVDTLSKIAINSSNEKMYNKLLKKPSQIGFLKLATE